MNYAIIILTNLKNVFLGNISNSMKKHFFERRIIMNKKLKVGLIGLGGICRPEFDT